MVVLAGFSFNLQVPTVSRHMLVSLWNGGGKVVNMSLTLAMEN